MIPKGADKLGGANALPIRLVMLATLLSLALIASMGWYVWNSIQVLRGVQVRTFRLLALTGQVSYLNEAVWASARLRMSTGEARWLDRYQNMLARRNAALAQFQTLAPDLYASPAATTLHSADEKLRKMETQAFALAARGQSAAAAVLLIGPAYDRQKENSVDDTTQNAANKYVDREPEL